ncbi:MAG: glycosyltransferase family 39 protein [Candidatus Shapirobacteria bacterium]|nr:glycosyltransferase family 39 protein [Candidatus Shapirobacteria bacterium]
MTSSKTLITLILILGFICRIIFVNQLPPSLNWDEVSHGYNAYSILKTGHDEWGIFLPTIFRCYGDFKLPLYIYSTVMSVSLFGLNTLSVRLVSILAGTLTPLVIYFILKKLSPSHQILPFIGLLITAFSPATIFLSRIALEANLFMFLFCLSFYFLISHKFGWSSFFFALGLFTYNSSRVLLPFYLFSLIFLVLKTKFDFKKKFFIFLPFLLLSGLTIFQTLNQAGQARYQWVSILDSGSINQINELRQTYPRFLINKVTYFTFTAAKNYFSHFSPEYLFFSGGSNYQFSLPNFYLISPLFIPFLLLGLVFLFKNKNHPHISLLILWFLASPIPSAITRDAPHVLRSILLVPITIIIISLGFDYSLKKFKALSIIYTILGLIIGQIFFWPKYIDYSKNFSSSWQYGYQQAIKYIKDNYQNYDQIVITKKYGEAHEFLLFYWSWDPKIYQTDNSKNWDYHATWYWVNAFDKFKFINDWEIENYIQNLNPNQKTLLITSPNNYNQSNIKHLETINFLNDSPAFEILETK